MNYVIAVSGGVDSIVLLDILARKQPGTTPSKFHLPNSNLLIAHVDHGIRDESSDDQRFVQALAKQYQLPYASTELKLGASANEETARDARYEFLFDLAKQHKAQVVTAHHQDDVIGSIAINLQRGTGWRGIAVMNRSDIVRPLLGWTKQKVYDYAVKHRLEWVEDATNASDKYLRNRLRKSIISLPGEVQHRLVGLRASQLQLARDMDFEIKRLVSLFAGSRYRYTAIDQAVAVELLKAQLNITRPQAELALLAIKTARSGTKHVIDGRLRLSFTKTHFAVDRNTE